MTAMFWRILYGGIVVAVLLFLSVPTLIVAGVSVSSGSLVVFPPEGFSLRWYANLFSRAEFLRSLGLSFGIAIVVALISAALSTLVAIDIGRGARPRLRAAVESAALMPLILPTIVYGPALLFFGADIGLTGGFVPSLILLLGAHVMITLPFTMRICLASYAAMPALYEDAAAVAGAGRLRIVWRVILPSIGAALLAGGLFAFLISFDEPVVSLFLTRQDLITLPVQMQTYMRFRPDPTIAALSTVMSALSLVAVLLVDRFFGLARVFGLNR